ncbi:DNA adenine methylase [Pantoea agglomerans]|uniref:DNA adenine methylase n=1 Tax=Enterobacter agglomerans TaxID=549 RepID=UPI0005E38B75|nr:DNA adenine methylase [Pantoea agglomerans]KJH63382.1 DNA adenine methylase [Pantoea agglomerans]
MKTILKWAGSKSGLMPELIKHLPAGDRLVEPFAGSCAVMMNTDYPAYLVADVNPDLINLYRQVKEHTRPFIVVALSLFNQNQTEENYYQVRKDFNFNAALPLLERAAQFLYLNRHGHRGLCRYNKRGEFNNPYGYYKQPYFPLAEIEAFAAKAQRATFECLDYSETLNMVCAGDVVYCDPPYHGTFTAYHTAGFSDDDQHSLACILLGISERNPVIVSNSDTLFTRSIYREFGLNKVTAARSISLSAGEKKQAAEIIAVRRPELSPSWMGFDMATGTDYSPESEVKP